MRLIDADALRKRWNVSEKCEDCKQDARYCDGNLYGSELYSLRDICGSIDDAPVIAAIPVEWLRNLCTIAKMEIDDEMFIDWLIRTWREEQETR